MSVSHRVYGLDILRSVAILTVVYAHGIFIFGNHINRKIYTLFALDGVTLFFVLSGFLIGGILLTMLHSSDLTARNLIHFWVRRWWRTLPNYFFVLSLLVLYFWYCKIPLPSFSVLASYFLFLQNFHSIHPSFFPEVWSLAVEEWFYFLIPLLWYISFRILKYDRKKIVFGWIIGIIVVINLYRIYRIQVYHISDFISWGDILVKQVLTRLDSIMIGVLGAYIFTYHSKIWKTYKSKLFYLGLICILYPQIHSLLFPQDIIFRNYFSLLFSSFGTLFLLPQLSFIKNGTGRLYQFFTQISALSYSLYLVHFTIVQWLLLPFVMKQIHFVFPLDGELAIRYSLYWIMSFTLAFFLYHLFEKPILRLRDKISP